ncbi:MAG: hypothetical protein NTW16_05650 [Bacteroidetes bacterium]|nr:hypothetical protein [Bacteroidota bacterium]
MNNMFNKHGPDFDVGFPATIRPRDGTGRRLRDGTAGIPRDGTERKPRDGTERMARDGTIRKPRDKTILMRGIMPHFRRRTSVRCKPACEDRYWERYAPERLKKCKIQNAKEKCKITMSRVTCHASRVTRHEIINQHP